MQKKHNLPVFFLIFTPRSGRREPGIFRWMKFLKDFRLTLALALYISKKKSLNFKILIHIRFVASNRVCSVNEPS